MEESNKMKKAVNEGAPGEKQELTDEMLDSVTGGMRNLYLRHITICPLCGNENTLELANGSKCYLCPRPGCGAIFQTITSHYGLIEGYDPFYAKMKP